jgi:hypothetical protein
LDKVDSQYMPGARVIEEGSPHPFEPDERQGWRLYKDAGVHVEYHPRDAVPFQVFPAARLTQRRLKIKTEQIRQKWKC